MRRRSFLQVGMAGLLASRWARGNSSAELYFKFQNSDTPVFPYEGGKWNNWGYVNAEGQILVPAETSGIRDRFSDFFGGLCVVHFEDKSSWMIDTAGVRRFQVYPDSDDWNYVLRDGLMPNRDRVSGLWGYVEGAGAWKIPATFTFAQPFADRRAVVTSGKLRGVINTDGDFVVKLSPIWAIGYNEGFLSVQAAGKAYLLDRDGHPAFQGLAFDWINSFQNGVATVQKGKKWGLIDRSGKLIAPIKYDGITFPEGSRPAPLVFEVGGLKGLMDFSGKEIVPASHLAVDYFSSGYALVGNGTSNYYIGPDGSPLFGTSFHHAEPFVLDRAVVSQDNRQFSWIDRAGKPVFTWKRDPNWNSLMEQMR